MSFWNRGILSRCALVFKYFEVAHILEDEDDFGADSSSRFTLKRRQTVKQKDRQTDATKRRTPPTPRQRLYSRLSRHGKLYSDIYAYNIRLEINNIFLYSKAENCH